MHVIGKEGFCGIHVQEGYIKSGVTATGEVSFTFATKRSSGLYPNHT